MIDPGARASALATQLNAVGEMLRAFATVDFSLPPAPEASLGAATPDGGPVAAGPAVTAGALAPDRGGLSRADLPPASRGSADAAADPPPAKSLAGLRPPTTPDPGAWMPSRAPASPAAVDRSTAPATAEARAHAASAPAGAAARDPVADDTAPSTQADRRPAAAGGAGAPARMALPVAPPAASEGLRPGPDDTVLVRGLEVPDPPPDAAISRDGASGMTDTSRADPARAASTDGPGRGPAGRGPAVILASGDVAGLPAATRPPASLAPPDLPARRDEEGPPRPRDEARAGERSPKGVPAGAVPTTAGRASEPSPVIRHEAVSDIDLRFLSEGAAGAGSGNGSFAAAGAAAALIFNAAMIPGWPPPRPFEMPSAEGLLAGLLSSPHVDGREGEMADRLGDRAGLAATAGTLKALLRRLPRARRSRALLGLMALMDTIEAVIEAVEGELLELSRSRRDGEDEWAEAGTRRQLTA